MPHAEELNNANSLPVLPNDSVPCLFLPYLKGSTKLIIFFHGNAEDIGISYEMLDHMRTALKINVLAVEYPGYGVYDDPKGPTEQ